MMYRGDETQEIIEVKGRMIDSTCSNESYRSRPYQRDDNKG